MAGNREPRGSLAQRLLAGRRRRFVGRTSEKELFESMLNSPEPAFILLYIHGPGGIGKTTLLAEFASTAQELGSTPVVLDGRNIDPSPEGFLLALRLVLGLDATAAPLQALAALQRPVLLLDTYETLNPLDGWLREQFFPQLPGNTLVVMAGRHSLSPGWRSDPGWRELIRPVSLRNLRPEESRDFLSRRGIPPSQHQALLDFTHGHPLALSLVADVLQGQQAEHLDFKPEASPDVVRTLLERFVEQVPSPAHRMALEACALVRVTNEALLAEILGQDQAGALFDWLRGLSFTESGPLGLFPHDLVREALMADLKWRNPDWNKELHRRARAYYTRKLQESRGLEQQRALLDDVYLHRDNPMVKPFLEWGEMGSVYGETAAQGDIPGVLEIIARHQGQAEAQIAAHWLGRQPQGFTVYRDLGTEPAGLLVRLALHQASPQDLALDPFAAQVWGFVQQQVPLRQGDQVLLFRWWMARESYQSVSPTQSLIFINTVQSYLSTPRLAWTFFPCADPDFWQPAFSYMELPPVLSVSTPTQTFGVFGMDWRTMPISAWLEMLGERELLTEPIPPKPTKPSLLVLSQPEFGEAIKSALRDYTRPPALGKNPLMRSRMVQQRGSDPGILHGLLREAAESLKANPKDEKLYRAIQRTYLEPAATQELAAELLDLPFSTYRRHLTAGLERITEWLWQREIQSLEGSLGEG